MQLLVYAVTYPVLWLFSNLPMPILFVFSDLVYYLLYYVLGYRKKVVRGNLSLAFPEKDPAELRKIEKRSYRHFVDVFFEMIKSFTTIIQTTKNLPIPYNILCNESARYIPCQ